METRITCLRCGSKRVEGVFKVSAYAEYMYWNDLSQRLTFSDLHRIPDADVDISTDLKTLFCTECDFEWSPHIEVAGRKKPKQEDKDEKTRLDGRRAVY